jgi:hypothetical protein
MHVTLFALLAVAIHNTSPIETSLSAAMAPKFVPLITMDAPGAPVI